LSFDDWLANGHLKRHVSSRDELEKLYRVIRRDIKAAGNRKMNYSYQGRTGCKRAEARPIAGYFKSISISLPSSMSA
jgi:hypothetical protein